MHLMQLTVYRWRIRELLADRSDGLTQSELARRSSVPFQTINRMAAADVERHPQRIDLETLDALASALGVSVADLFTREPD
jgi:transcriptional regulator with XRE-family HTH domain